MEKEKCIEEGKLEKKVLLASGALGFGLAMGGRTLSGGLVIPTLPPAIDLLHGKISLNKEQSLYYLAYGLGVTAAYADKVAYCVDSFLQLFS